jgi:Oligosaccaryltransferase
MITERGLTAICNGLGGLAMFLIFAYHFVSVNGKKMEESASHPHSE